MEDVAIFWDYENCPAPTNTSGCAIVNSLRSMAKPYGSVRSFKAYLAVSDLLSVARANVLRSEFQASGVSLIDCPHNGRKEVADKMIIVDMLTYAIDNPAPATIILISGDRDFAYALSILGLRHYRVVLVTLPNAHSSLTAQASTCILYSDVLNKIDQLPNNYSSYCNAFGNRPLPPSGIEPLFQGREKPSEEVDRTDQGDLVGYFHNITEKCMFTETYDKPFKYQNYEWLKKSQDPDIGLSPVPRGVSEYDSVEPQRPRVDTVKSVESTVSASTHSALGASDSTDAQCDTPRKFYSGCVKSSYSPVNSGFSFYTKQNNNLINAASGELSRQTASAFDNCKQSRALDGNQAVPCDVVEPSKVEYPSLIPSPRPVLEPPTSRGTIATMTVTPPMPIGLSTETGNNGSEEASSTGFISPKREASGSASHNPHMQARIPETAVDKVVALPDPKLAPTCGDSVTSLAVPPIFRILVKSLQAHKAKGVSRPSRSNIAVEVAKNGSTYKNAGVAKFSQYAALAVKNGIVELGGMEGAAWISLKSEWFNANVDDI